MAKVFVPADLEFGENTLLTLDEADEEAAIEGYSAQWDRMAETDRIAALMRAFRRLSDYTFCLQGEADYDPFSHTGFELYDDGCDEFDHQDVRLSELTPSEIADLPEAFLDALRAAQGLEAADSAACGSDESQRNDGVVMKTQGPVTTLYRSGRQLETPFCKDAMRVLENYICTRRRLARG